MHRISGRRVSQENLHGHQLWGSELQMCCSVVSRAKKSLLPSVSDVTYDFGTQALWVCVCDALGPPGFQRSPGISSSEVLWAPGLHLLDLWHL